MRWEKSTIDPTEVRELSRRYDIDLLTATILTRRGVIEPEEICYYLEDDLRFLHNPFLFVEMEEAVDRINVAIDEGQPIFVFGDRDVDGMTSTVLLVDALRDLGATVSWGVPLGDNSYGLTMETVQEMSSASVQLLITVDCGISNVGEIARATELGIETILLDHHHPHEQVPSVAALVNPRMEDSGYPFEHLSACAVASKLAWALRFTRTSAYGQTVVVLSVYPVNEAYVVEAVKLTNLIEVERLHETLAPGFANPADSRLVPFAEGCEIFVHNLPQVTRQLERCFATKVDLPATDLAPLIAENYPSLAGKSLLRLKEHSRMARYHDSSEVDVLANLFVSLILKREDLLGSGMRDLDLVAMSTLADNMPLRGENRLLVKNGLVRMARSERRGLRELLMKKNLWGKQIDAKSVSWQVSPVLNSTGRMGEPNKAVELLLSQDGEGAADLIQYINELNNRRKKMEDKIWDVIQSKARDSFERTNSRFVFVIDQIVQRGVTGLLAGRLSRLFRAPALVAACLDGRIVGSLRSPRSVNVKSFLDGFADLLTDYGGHDFAAGFNMPTSNRDAFETRFYELAGEVDSEAAREDLLHIDAEIPAKLLDPSLFEVADRFEPYGEGNPPLIFMTRGMKVLSYDAVGKNKAVHLKLLLGCGQHKWPAIWWNNAERAGRDFNIDDQIDVAYRLSRSEWRGQQNLQLTILDIKK